MLTEQVVIGTHKASPDNSSAAASEASIAVFDLHTYSQTASFKRSSTAKNCLAVTPSHLFAAQSDKAVLNVYNRSKQNLESTVPFQEKFTVIEASGGPGAFIAGGTDSGRLTIWEVRRCCVSRNEYDPGVTVSSFADCHWPIHLDSANPPPKSYLHRL